MSMQKVNVLAPRALPPAQGASLAGVIVQALLAIVAGCRAASATLDARGAERRTARRTARQRARDHAAILALARRYESSQPEFAKDLYAAARADR